MGSQAQLAFLEFSNICERPGGELKEGTSGRSPPGLGPEAKQEEKASWGLAGSSDWQDLEWVFSSAQWNPLESFQKTAIWVPSPESVLIGLGF